MQHTHIENAYLFSYYFYAPQAGMGNGYLC